MQDHAHKRNTIVARLFAITRPVVALGFVNLVSACAQSPTENVIDQERLAIALLDVEQRQSRGQRVWCVPYARNLSGINIRGNAKDWWGKAKNVYARGDEPGVGSVMSFRATRGMSLGHVAVVSDVVSDRQIVVNHANWNRNKVSLKMGVMDVSKDNDWTLVRVESQPGKYGSVYPVSGFIYPNDGG